MTVNDAIAELERIRSAWGGDITVANAQFLECKKFDPYTEEPISVTREGIYDVVRISCEMSNEHEDAKRKAVLR